eukprot:scaffold74590_cov22-Tisochrysis_lutea.AAC.1
MDVSMITIHSRVLQGVDVRLPRAPCLEVVVSSCRRAAAQLWRKRVPRQRTRPGVRDIDIGGRILAKFGMASGAPSPTVDDDREIARSPPRSSSI